MSPWLWVGFLALILLLLALDLGLVNRRAHVIRLKEALGWSAFYVALALLFSVFVYGLYEHHWLGAGGVDWRDVGGHEAALEFFTAWLLEKSLSLDNVFVIALIFSYFGIPRAEQHRVLFWGILGALLLRGVMILAGAALIERFEWIIYVFGAILVFSAVKLFVSRNSEVDPAKNPLVRFVRRFYPVTHRTHGSHFFVVENGRRACTPLFLALLVVESSDVLFAVDSIPAVFAVTHDPFLVFTSNIFAILGLRALYFVLADLIERFRYLQLSLVFILAYVGIKMLLSHVQPIPNYISLIVIATALAVGMISSWALTARVQAWKPAEQASPVARFCVGTMKQVRRFTIMIAGGALIVVGAVLLVLPGPGTVVIAIGLAVLGLEFAFARRWLAKSKDFAKGVGRAMTGKRSTPEAPDETPPADAPVRAEDRDATRVR